MYDTTRLSTTDVLILCGGMGTRLQPVSGGGQKILVEFAGRPFIDILIESLLPFGFQRFILCIGYERDRVKRHFISKNLEVVFSGENKPLGTGGAVKNAMPYVRSSPFLLLNGDSLCRIDYTKFLEFHSIKGGLLSIVLANPMTESGYGVIDINDNGRITSFKEKAKPNEGNYVNAGIYLMNYEVFRLMPHLNKFSLEYDLFPKALMHGCYGFVTEEEVIDIGTPERYLRAKSIFS